MSFHSLSTFDDCLCSVYSQFNSLRLDNGYWGYTYLAWGCGGSRKGERFIGNSIVLEHQPTMTGNYCESLMGIIVLLFGLFAYQHPPHAAVSSCLRNTKNFLPYTSNVDVHSSDYA